MRQWLVLGSQHNEYKRVQTPARDYTIQYVDKETVARVSQHQLGYCTVLVSDEKQINQCDYVFATRTQDTESRRATAGFIISIYYHWAHIKTLVLGYI